MISCKVLAVPHYGSEYDAVKFIDAFLSLSHTSDVHLIFGWNGSLNDFPASKNYTHIDNVHLIEVSTPGSYAVRNKIIDYAKALNPSYIAFTDSDCKIDQLYLNKIANIYSGDLLAGKINITCNDQHNWIFCYEKIFEFDQDRSVRKGGAVTANLIVRYDLAEKIGGFRADLKSGADKMFCQAAIKNGYKLSYRSDIVVEHPSRETWREIRKKYQRTYCGWYKIFGWYKKNKIYQSAMLLHAMRPPVNGIKRIFRSDENYFVKYKALIVLVFIRVIRAEQHVRLVLGQDERR